MISSETLLCCSAVAMLAALPSLFVLLRVRRLEDLSYRDYQTGLRSVRLLDDDLALLGRIEAPIALVLVDLDDFRRFNEAIARMAIKRRLLQRRPFDERLRVPAIGSTGCTPPGTSF